MGLFLTLFANVAAWKSTELLSPGPLRIAHGAQLQARLPFPPPQGELFELAAASLNQTQSAWLGVVRARANAFRSIDRKPGAAISKAGLCRWAVSSAASNG